MPTEHADEVAATGARSWRRPHSYWVLPFILCTTFNLGLTTPSRAEIVLDVACMAHPPQPSGSSTGWGPATVPIDPDQCKRDSGVQSAVIRLTTLIILTTGLLSALTTGFWMQRSNRVGRRKVMAGAVLGLLLHDTAISTLISFPALLRDNNYLLIGPIFEGTLGSFAVLMAVAHAYVADVTPEGSRASAFARITACLMGGFMGGPALGSALAAASGSILFPFQISILLNTVSVLCIRFLLPESLTQEKRESYITASALAPLRPKGHIARLLTPLRPLTFLLPNERGSNLTFLAVGVFCLSMLFGLIPIKIMYTQFVFGWDQATTGPYLSFFALCRFAVLLGVVPVAVSLLKPYYGSEPHHSETERLLPTKPSSALDMTVLRTSVVFEAAGLLMLTANAEGSITQFLIGSMVGAIGAAHMPTAYSLGLSLVDPSETAQLFGGLGILQSIANQVLSPFVFGIAFDRTVEWYPPFAFGIAALLAVTATTMFAFVRIPNPGQIRV